MAEGWIALNRRLEDHWLWEDKPFSKGQAWIDLIMMANHEEKKIPFGNEIVLVKRGSRITSISKLSIRWGWSRKKVLDFLKVLEKEKMLVRKSDTKKTLLTIVNYGIYQDLRNTKETQKSNKKAAKEQLRNINNNDNNDNNDNKNNISPPDPEEQLPEGAVRLPDGTVSYANVKREWD